MGVRSPARHMPQSKTRPPEHLCSKAKAWAKLDFPDSSGGNVEPPVGAHVRMPNSYRAAAANRPPKLALLPTQQLCQLRLNGVRLLVIDVRFTEVVTDHRGLGVYQIVRRPVMVAECAPEPRVVI